MHGQRSESALNDILFNLIKNAIEAVSGGETRQIEVSTEMMYGNTSPARAVIRVADSGPGIAPEIQKRMFEPFVSGKSDGTGLGLFLVAQQVRELNGEIKCISNAEGSVFEVSLPPADMGVATS